MSLPPGLSLDSAPTASVVALADTLTTTYAEPVQTTPATTSSPPAKGGNNTLYLFTFLTTLLLLLAVSCGIIFRSFMLRRRFRRRVEEALAAGTPLPSAEVQIWLNGGRTSRRPHVNLNEKPNMWEVALGEGTLLNDVEGWSSIIQPVATTVQRPPFAGERPSLDNPPAPAPPPRRRRHILPMLSLEHLLWQSDGEISGNPITTVQLPEPTPTPASKPKLRLTDSASATEPRISVSVLVAMPDAKRPIHGTPHWPWLEPSAVPASSSNEKEGSTITPEVAAPAERPYSAEELPDVVFGVMEADWLGTSATKPRKSSSTES